MSIRVRCWTGREVLWLQQALRMSNRDLADRLGVSLASVKNWRKGGEDWVCNPGTSQLFDRAVELMSPAELAAFRALLEQAGTEFELVGQPVTLAGDFSLTSHQFIPLHLGPMANALFDRGALAPPGPAALDRRLLKVPTGKGRDGSLYVYAFGVAVLHVRQQLRLKSVTDLALWRYPAYGQNRAWAQQAVSTVAAGLLGSVSGVPLPDYVLSVYELHQHPWDGAVLDSALQLLATPGVLVDRSDEDNPLPLGIEEQRLAAGWNDPDSIGFSGGMSRGVASWSGVAYHPHPDERALTIDDIVAMELDTQALWALSTHLLGSVEGERDPAMPEPFGWRWLRGAHTRLTSARPTETAQHRAMRAAVIGTSDLPDRLQHAWTALKEAS
ncbi:XRE family transcriptional regulator [Kitasatospora sp. NPDC127060]|uniref:XRE family transcriptional regulator n=1 Tax=Kitasatospora sp. NPDC127060 TaxID=3347121 RepID=UPI00364D324A